MVVMDAWLLLLLPEAQVVYHLKRNALASAPPVCWHSLPEDLWSPDVRPSDLCYEDHLFSSCLEKAAVSWRTHPTCFISVFTIKFTNFLWGDVTQKRQWQNHGCVALSRLCSFVPLNFIADIPEVPFPWAFKSVALCDLCIRCTRRFCWNCNEINMDFLGYIWDAVPTAATQLRQAEGRACLCFPAISHCSSGLICCRALPSRVFSPIPAAQSLFPPEYILFG